MGVVRRRERRSAMSVWARPGGLLGEVRERLGWKGEDLRDAVGRGNGVAPVGVGVEVLNAVECDAEALEDVAYRYVYMVSKCLEQNAVLSRIHRSST